MAGFDPNATIRARRRPNVGRRWLAMGVAAAIGAAFAGWLVLRPGPAAAPDLPRGEEAAILGAPADQLGVWRFADDPAILVLVFPSLHAQALMFNRVAAFIEKAGTPRDRVLDDAALADAAGHTAAQFDQYYLGHDYRAADLLRFLSTAQQQHVALRAEERAIDGLLRSSGAAAVITLPPPGTVVDAAGRAAILRHELAHGAYFVEPAYAAFVSAFWRGLSEATRLAFRDYLEARGYDPANDDLIRNEMQAYLVFTPDPRLFRPQSLAIGAEAAARLRADFVARMPPGWWRARAD